MSSQVTTALKVTELFAGVGGFRLGLESIHGKPFEVTLSNQFEPARKVQHASNIYDARWRDGKHINEDIFAVLASETGRQTIRDAAPDLLVGGFPCQDYSVAKPLSQSKGLVGKKGVLWWSIAELLQQRNADGEPVKYLLLENVDRLITSPATCKGRDFAVILATLASLGYAAEWRVINAADYGYPQRRRRVFLVAYHRSTAVYRALRANVADATDCSWFSRTVINSAFPAVARNPLDGAMPALHISNEPFDEQLRYRPLSNGKSQFSNCGVMFDGDVRTLAVDTPSISDFTEYTGHAAPLTLGDIVRNSGPVPSSFYVRPEDEERWYGAKGAKNVPRVKNGFTYNYSEGAMPCPDPLDRPSRTIITSEGGTTPTRTKHIIREPGGLLRRLTPEELEALNGFPGGHTAIPGVSDATRAMLMGNALVVPLVTRIGEALHKVHTQHASAG
ncbi:DNA (cytosine-5)-methyltransferase 1 [Paraburkholderia sp. GAS199]|uniref:DNA (cytosine-5-)-methyltransferase n=1 Tax=Paraburkholderia sp. GAS199 TaxID=3035126 RepID=UPI003D1C7DEB